MKITVVCLFVLALLVLAISLVGWYQGEQVRASAAERWDELERCEVKVAEREAALSTCQKALDDAAPFVVKLPKCQSLLSTVSAIAEQCIAQKLEVKSR